MNIKEQAEKNVEFFKNHSYVGRGIVIGQSPDKKNFFQIYWIMGRSENSRNRIFLQENENVKTEAFDSSKLSDPSLIIYYPVRQVADMHIVTNGDQTDTIEQSLINGGSFEDALETRTYEPDAPNYTPRISGITYFDGENTKYSLSVLKNIDKDASNRVQRSYFNYEESIPGYGHFIHTYEKDGNPLVSFEGEPKAMPIFNTVDENLEFYWNNLNEDNKVSLLVKSIDAKNGESSIKIVNKLK